MNKCHTSRKNSFISPDLAEDRNVFCGNCSEPVKGHLPSCPHCNKRFHANIHGYARLCKNPSCRRTEMAGHPHGLCRFHYEGRKQRQINSAMQPNCSCGSKASYGEVTCSRCRAHQESLTREAISEFKLGIISAAADLVRDGGHVEAAITLLRRQNLDDADCSDLDYHDKEQLIVLRDEHGLALSGLD